MSNDNAGNWAALAPMGDVAVAMLMPVSGETGAVYALTTASRTPLALGSAPQTSAVASIESAPVTPNYTGTLAWVLAVLAGFGLTVLAVMEIRERGQGSAKMGLPAAV